MFFLSPVFPVKWIFTIEAGDFLDLIKRIFAIETGDFLDLLNLLLRPCSFF